MSKRIGYIDAMRGFTMILVVYSHVCGFCLGDRQMALNDVLFLFRLPCFFFISGWLFAGTVMGTAPRVSSEADYTGTVPHVTFWSIIKKKFMVQIVPTLFFLFLLSPPPAFFHQFGAFKGGYWFTFALFYFFIIYMLMAWPFRRHQSTKSDVVMLLLTLAISMSAYWYDINYHRLVLAVADTHGPMFNVQCSTFNVPCSMFNVLGLLSYVVWRYYLFFFLGTLVRKYFPQFLKIAGNGKLVACLAIIFLAISQIPQSDIFLREYFKFSVGGILGMTVIFALFRYLYTSPLLSQYSSIFHHPSSILKFVGTRTLDIYLLHYFFLPEFLLPHANRLLATIPSWLLPLPILFAAFIVVVLCLLTSYIIRLNPFLAHYLFGAKKK